MQNYLAEFIGTLILVTLGDGVVANVLLAKSKGNNAGWIVITTGWGLAVTMGIYCVGRISGAHLNPAVTLALLSTGQFPAADVPGYIVAQMLGAMGGAVLVYLSYLPHWAETEDADAKLGVFCTAPGMRASGANFLCEVIGTALLLYGVLSIGANAGAISPDAKADLAKVFSTGIAPLLTGFLVWSIGLSLGGPTGYSLNPARDLGPRIMHMLLPIPGKRDPDWGYSWIPVMGPIVGGIVGAWIFKLTGF